MVGAMGSTAYGYWLLTGPDEQYLTPGAILIAGGVTGLAVCSITATMIFSKGKSGN